MATNWLARRSRGHSIGTEAESISGGRQFPAVNARSYHPGSEDSRNAFRGRKNSSRSRNPNIFSRSRSGGRAEERQPGTAGRISRSKSQSRREVGEAQDLLSRSTSGRTQPTFNFEEATNDSAELPPPRLARLDCVDVQNDVSKIGVAVGSPSQLQPENPRSFDQAPLARMETEPLDSMDHQFDDSANKTKGAKWKKIGGLFKARSVLRNDTVQSPFYQLQATGDSQSSHYPPAMDTAPQDQAAKFLFDKILGANGQLDPQNYVENPLQQIPEIQGGIEESTKQTLSPLGLPLLDIKIPDVQMERYSVMFGSLLDKQEPPGLLLRREKALEKLLTTPDGGDAEPFNVAHLHKQQPDGSGTTFNSKGQSHLTADAHNNYPRRATSPTSSKSPSFSLFPHLPQARERNVGPIPPPKHSPLQRSFTSPARLSPMQESFNFHDVQPPKAIRLHTNEKPTSSSHQTASMTHTERNSSNQSVLSPASTCSSVNEDVQKDIKSLDMLKRTQDQPEVMTDQELKVAPLKPRHVLKDARSELVKTEEVDHGLKTKNMPDTHEDTLAALERPRSVSLKSKDASVGLKPSKARIDQIMRGPTPNKLPHPSATTLPKQAHSEAVEKVPRNMVQTPPKPTTLASDTDERAASAAPATVFMSKEQEMASAPRFTNLNNEVVSQPTLPLARNQHQSRRDSSDNLDALERQYANAAHSAENALGPRSKQVSTPSQTGERRPSQSNQGQAQSPPAAASASHRLHPLANGSPSGRPPLNATNQSFPRYVPPPSSSTMRSRSPFDRMRSQVRPSNRSNTTPETEKEHDNILDYYLEGVEANSSSRRPKSPKRLQKRLSDRSKKALSLSNKPLPYLKPQAPSSKSPETAPRSPIPISKYSTNAATILKPVTSPSITSPTIRHHHSQSHSSIFPEQASADSRLLSPGVRAAREKAAHLIDDATLHRTRSTSTSSLALRPSRADFSFVVDAPLHSEYSFYTHSNANTPSLENTNSRPATPNEGCRINLAEQPGPGGKPPVPKRSPSRRTSLSSLPLGAGAGGLESSSTAQKPKPPQPTRSASAGTVGSGSRAGTGPSGIQGRLKPEKGEKVVEKRAGLVPTIVDAEKGHRAGKSVKLVIESV